VAALLPDEDLQPHHQVLVDVMFAKKQHGYRRTAANLAERANSFRTEEQKRAAKAARMTSAIAIAEPAPFRHRGFSERTIKALVNCSIDAPERLLFMKPADIKKIPGLGEGIGRRDYAVSDEVHSPVGRLRSVRKAHVDDDIRLRFRTATCRRARSCRARC
jgi:hypothetical protein